MVSTTKIKSVDFYRKIPRDLTEASLSGAGLSIIAALAMMFLFGMELSTYLAVTTQTSVVVDNSTDDDFLQIDFNVSFPALSCEFASVDVSDVLSTNRLNLTKTIKKVPIDPHLRETGEEYHPTPDSDLINHGDEHHDDNTYASMSLNGAIFDRISHKYGPENDGRVLLGSVDCTEEPSLCTKDDHGHQEHDSYHGNRDTESLLKMVEELLRPIKKFDGTTNHAASSIRKAPVSGGCRIEGYVRAKKVPGELVISAVSGSHSFDASRMNMTHFVNHLSFGRLISDRLLTDMKRLLPYLGLSHDRLNGKWFVNEGKFAANVTIEHYLQVVKTEVVSRRFGQEHSVIEEYEYTAHSSVAHGYYYPVAKFHFDLSPMQVLISENPKSFSHFLTNVCAIIGGVFTVAGILDSIFQSTYGIMKKVELGKNF
ncbi:hypothetical protein HA466_0206860 [Hirschfeldia incana]|nr:hypothetical protein HA466_0206860 [Hirschfeldia incana]